MERIDFIKSHLEKITDFLNIKPSTNVTFENEVYYVDIEGDNLSFLIGFRGDSLDGLQHFLGMALFKEFNEWASLVVDINKYRFQKKEKLEEMAKSFIDRVRFFSKEVEMPPMSPFERRQIHEFVNNYSDIESYSVGEGSSRRVVLKPAK